MLKKSIVLACLLACGTALAGYVVMQSPQLTLNNQSGMKMRYQVTSGKCLRSPFKQPKKTTPLVNKSQIVITVPATFNPYCLTLFQHHNAAANFSVIRGHSGITIKQIMKNKALNIKVAGSPYRDGSAVITIK